MKAISTFFLCDNFYCILMIRICFPVSQVCFNYRLKQSNYNSSKVTITLNMCVCVYESMHIYLSICMYDKNVRRLPIAGNGSLCLLLYIETDFICSKHMLITMFLVSTQDV